ncbi:MAG: insulinase family protein [Propionibacteriaceae bacterium]|jgi:predicted Zn-dependent peptidase|nr:insulinase family protein [Propionibacteriaceae bacterium]
MSNVISASAANRRPKIGRPALWHFPSHQEWQLDNGLRVWTFDLPGQAVLSADVILDIALAVEPRELEGVASLSADIADEGTLQHPGEEFIEKAESAGVQFTAQAAYQSTRLGVDVSVDRLETALTLLSEALQYPRYDPVDVARHVADEFTNLADMASNPFAKTANALRAALFPSSWRESRRPAGDQQTLARIDAAALHTFHDSYYSPECATLIVAGQLPENVATLLQRTLGSWEPLPSHALRTSSLPLATSPRNVWVVDHPGAVQNAVYVSCLTPTRGHADLESLQIGAIAMGGSFLSRLNAVLREERGYTYGAGCSVVPLRHIGNFTAHARCRNDALQPLLAELLELLCVSTQPFTSAEIDNAIDYAIGVAPLAYDTAEAIATQAGGFVAAGMEPEWFDLHQEACLRVTPATATAAFTRWINPDQLQIVVGGDAASLVPKLDALGLHPNVVDAFGQLIG